MLGWSWVLAGLMGVKKNCSTLSHSLTPSTTTFAAYSLSRILCRYARSFLPSAISFILLILPFSSQPKSLAPRKLLTHETRTNLSTQLTMKGTFSAAALALASLTSAKIIPRQSGNLPTVTSEGNAFWTSNGERFYIRGVAYQPGGAADAQDPMLDLDTFRNDVEAFKELGINTIRIYTIDNSANHDEAMKLLDDAGIYLSLDVNTPKASLNRENIDSLHASYNDVYLQSVFATVDAFAGYSEYIGSKA